MFSSRKVLYNKTDLGFNVKFVILYIIYSGGSISLGLTIVDTLTSPLCAILLMLVIIGHPDNSWYLCVHTWTSILSMSSTWITKSKNQYNVWNTILNILNEQ